MKLSMPKIFKGSRRQPILNFRSIGFNISPAIIRLKINAVRVGNALLQETEGKQSGMGWKMLQKFCLFVQKIKTILYSDLKM